VARSSSSRDTEASPGRPGPAARQAEGGRHVSTSAVKAELAAPRADGCSELATCAARYAVSTSTAATGRDQRTFGAILPLPAVADRMNKTVRLPFIGGGGGMAWGRLGTGTRRMRHRAGRTKGVVEPSAEAAQQLRIDVGNQPIPAQSNQ
jgi:hypothetical protein